MKVLTTVKDGSAEDVGGFVKQDSKTKRWYAMEESSARTSTAQAFRDALSGTYRSSKQFKQQRRWNLIGDTPISGGISENQGTDSATEAGTCTRPEDQGRSTAVDQPQVMATSVLSRSGSPPDLQLDANTEGLGGILHSALGVIDEGLFYDTSSLLFDGVMPNYTASIVTRGEDLSVLLDQYENQVEMTENPYEPTPLFLTNSSNSPGVAVQGIVNGNLPDFMQGMPKVAHSTGGSQCFSLRSALTM